MYNFFFFLKFFLIKKTYSYCKELYFKKIINYLKIFFFEIFKIRNTINLLFYKNKKYLFISHLDVVNEGFVKWINKAFNCKCYKKKIFCRGIIDMKGGFCSFFYIQKKNNFLLTNDEENVSIYGTQYVINILKNRNITFFLYFGGEPTSSKLVGDNIKISRRGSYNFKIIFIGKQKHCAYIGKNIITFVLKKIFFFKKKINKNEIIEINNLISISKGTNITPVNFFLKINYRFLFYNNIIKIKKFFFLKFKNNLIYFKWTLSGIPFICYKNYFLEKIFNSVFLIQNILPKINFLGGTSDLRYCYVFNNKIFIFEIGLLNKSIHKVNEYSCFDNLFILNLIYFNFLNGIR
ncbi:MAG: M20/M25/M40 family metallo-hydrolase [Candidatus Carsonella ruddii]